MLCYGYDFQLQDSYNVQNSIQWLLPALHNTKSSWTSCRLVQR